MTWSAGEVNCFITNADADWKVQLAHNDLLLQNGKIYNLSFTGRTTGPAKSVTLILRHQGPPYNQYFSQTFNLSASMTSYSNSFTMTEASDANTQLLVFLGNDTTTVTLDDFSLGFEVTTGPFWPSYNYTAAVNQSSRYAIADNAGVPVYPWFPDGHISVIPEGTNWMMFWAEYESYRTLGPSQYPQEHFSLSPDTPVIGYRNRDSNTFNNGGSWLMSVHRQSGNDLIGFIHAEDHWTNPLPNTNSPPFAWKSIGRVTSSDNGQSFGNAVQIITSSNTKPATPQWGGTGDFCIIRDETNSRWVCIFQEHYLYAAVSTDPDASPGTWYKWKDGSWNSPGLGGDCDPILSSHAGANPSLHWNTYLNKWIMVWQAWADESIYLSGTTDFINWDPPVKIISPVNGLTAQYVTIIGDSDVQAGENAWIYWADFKAVGRDWFRAPISFTRFD